MRSHSLTSLLKDIYAAKIISRPRLLPPIFLLLAVRCDGLRHPQQARLPSFPAARAECVQARARLLQECPKTRGAAPEMRKRQFHPRRSGRRDKLRLFASLPARAASREIAASKPSRNRAASFCSNRGLLDWMRSYLDKLAHIGWACACRWGGVALKRNHPQTRPSSGSWVESESPLRFARGEFQTASALRCLRTL